MEKQARSRERELELQLMNLRQRQLQQQTNIDHEDGVSVKQINLSGTVGQILKGRNYTFLYEKNISLIKYAS